MYKKYSKKSRSTRHWWIGQKQRSLGVQSQNAEDTYSGVKSTHAGPLLGQGCAGHSWAKTLR